MVYEIDRLDEQYNQLLNEGIKELKIIERMAVNANRRHNLFYSIVRERDSARTKLKLDEWRSLKTINSSYFDTILSLNHNVKVQQKMIKDAQDARSKYNDFSERQMEILLSDRSFERQMDMEEFDLLFENYQDRINDLFLSEHNSMQSSSMNLASQVESKIRKILLFAFTPVVAVLCLVVFMYLMMHFYFLKGKAYY